MAKAGCDVTVYEAFHDPGGVLRYGIPEFRLPNYVIDAEIENLTRLGVKIECNTLVGRLFTIEQMLDEMGFHAVFIGTGAGYPSFMRIPGESLNGVLSANELLTRVNLMGAGDFPEYDTPLDLGKKVAVIGSGNTAMDAMRVSLRLGAEKVYCVYRRSRAESPARAEEVHHAEEEGVEFHWLTAPVEILGDDDGNVVGMRNIRMELGEPDDSGRRRPVPIEGSEYEFEADMVVYAIGTNANPIIGQTSKIKLNKWGYIDADENLATSIAGVYAGGDIVTGGATVILAMGAGRQAARSMKAYLGITDTDTVYRPETRKADGKLFGIDPGEKNFSRVRLAQTAQRKFSQTARRETGICWKPDLLLRRRRSPRRLPRPRRQAGARAQGPHRRGGQRLGRRRAEVRPVVRDHRRQDGQRHLDRRDHPRRDPASRAGASRAPAATASAMGSYYVTNGGDEADLVVAFNEQVLLGRVRYRRAQAGLHHPAGEQVADRPEPGDRQGLQGDLRPADPGWLPGLRDPHGGGVPQVRRRPHPRQEHVRAGHSRQHLQPGPADRPGPDRLHLRQEERQGHQQPTSSFWRRATSGRRRTSTSSTRFLPPASRSPRSSSTATPRSGWA